MDLSQLRVAALDLNLVEGFTHGFYRYPARFTPVFAATAIREFSKPGDLVCDPYMGGGTTIVEALAAGRRAVGTDINSLAVFIARAKTSALSRVEAAAVSQWAQRLYPEANYRHPRESIAPILADPRTRNLSLPRARAIKKVIGILLQSLHELPTNRARRFARCVVLRTAQWALDNRKRPTPLTEFRARLTENLAEMLNSITEFSRVVNRHRLGKHSRILLQQDAATLDATSIFRTGQRVDLVVASPPYPGVHMLYHRWQVNGRRESPGAYWIADCQDGHGTSYYTFGDRRRDNLDVYFKTSLATLRAVRKVMRTGGIMVQMLAFSDPRAQLPRYLENMRVAGFEDIVDGSRIWREVPNRKWHATFKGQINSSREVVLVHRAA